MLPARHRLRHRADFDIAMRGGRRAGRRSVVVHVGAAADAHTPARVGLVVSKAVGNSVVRSRVSRRLRHAVQPLLSALPDGSLVVLRATGSTAEASWDELCRDLGSALTSAGRPRTSGRDVGVS